VPVRLLEAITPDIATPRERLRELQQLEYLHDRSDGTQQLYRFKHALTQEVAYSSLLAEHRRGLHARVVGAIEVQYADRLGEQTEKLAHHAVRGQLWERAAPYLRQAGLKAADRSANHEAVACLEQALEALGHLPGGRATIEAIDLHLDLGRVLVPLADYGGCLEHLSEAAKLADARGERGRRGRALASQCLMLRITGATSDAIEAGRAALAIATEVSDADLAATASFFLGTTHHTRGEFREAAACYRAGLIPLTDAVTPERARMLPRYTGGVRAWLAWTLESLGEFGEALVLGREAVQIAEARGDRAPDAAARCLLANVHLGLGDTDSAIPLLEQALILCRAHDVRDWAGFVAMRLGFAYAQAGRLADGIRLLEEGDAHCAAIRGVTGHATRLAGFAQSLLLAGRHAEAGETARRGVALAREQYQPAGEALCLRAIGMVTAAAEPSGTAAAEAYFTQARDMAATLEMRPLVAHCHFDLGQLFRSTERHHEARERLAAATLLYRDMGMQLWLDEATAELKKVP
jgi:tetratricopeptide (TPR) repeat protein